VLESKLEWEATSPYHWQAWGDIRLPPSQSPSHQPQPQPQPQRPPPGPSSSPLSILAYYILACSVPARPYRSAAPNCCFWGSLASRANHDTSEWSRTALPTSDEAADLSYSHSTLTNGSGGAKLWAVDGCLWRRSAPQSPPDPPRLESRRSCASIHPRDRGKAHSRKDHIVRVFSCPQGRWPWKVYHAFFYRVTQPLCVAGMGRWIRQIAGWPSDLQFSPAQAASGLPNASRELACPSASRSLSEVQPKYLVLKSMFSCCMTIGWER